MTSDRMWSSSDRARAEAQMQAWIMGIRPQLEDRLDLLFEQASDLEKRYLEALGFGEDPGVEQSGEPALGLRVRRCGDAVVRHWYGIDGSGANGDERAPRQGYSGGADAGEREPPRLVEHLSPHTSGWDDALASEVEDEVNQYRHWAQCIAEMLVNLERLQRCVQARRLISVKETRAKTSGDLTGEGHGDEASVDQALAGAMKPCLISALIQRGALR